MAGPRWALGWDEVRAEAFAQFGEQDFELLCRELIEVEVSDRQAADAELEGPPRRYAPGKDLVGPPGVGKTRLLLESLRQKDWLRRRAVVAPSFEDGETALKEHRLHERYPSAILVVDDCPPHAVDALLRWLPQYNHHGMGALLVVTPISSEATAARECSSIARLDLLPLEMSARGQFIAREIQEPVGSERVETIAYLTGGFPWYAALVAREVKTGAPLPKTAADAARLALCSRYEGSRASRCSVSPEQGHRSFCPPIVLAGRSRVEKRRSTRSSARCGRRARSRRPSR